LARRGHRSRSEGRHLFWRGGMAVAILSSGQGTATCRRDWHNRESCTVSTLFLSYARSDDEPFVRRLYGDLTAAGFDVWFDRVSMPSRNLTFHEEIRDAIAARERLLLVIGPGAVASEYVRQEWQFAWFTAEKLVAPILRMGDYPLVPDELKLLHCEDFRDDPSYAFHLEQLIRILREPPAPLGKLIAVPSLPAHFVSRSEGWTKIRDALRADLDRPVVISGAVARVGLHGMGGIGKSVLASALAHDRKVREAFPDGIVWIGFGALPDLRARMQDAHRALGGDGAIATENEGKEKLMDLLSDKAVLLVIDDVRRRSDAIAFDVLGARCRALITSRDAGLLTSLGGAHHAVDLLTEGESLRLLAVASGIEREALQCEVLAVLGECGGLPLAVALAGGIVRAGTSWSDLLDALRSHELEFLEDRHAASEQHVSLWRMIEVSVQALSSDVQERLAELAVFPQDEQLPEAAVTTLWQHTGDVSERQSRRLLVDLEEHSLVQLARADATKDGSVGTISLHDLIHDYCVRLAGLRFGGKAALHSRLLEAYQRICPEGWWRGPDDGHFFSHLRDHLIAAGRGGELGDLLHELQWLEAKNAAGLAFDLPLDFRAAMAVLARDDPRRRRLRLIDQALRRDLHFIDRHRADYPQGLFQCLWNSGWWYDCASAAAHHDPPPDGWREDGAPWEQCAKDRLATLLESWREAMRQRNAGFTWLEALRPPRFPLGGALLMCLSGHEDWVNCVSFDPAGRRIVSGSDDNMARIWGAESGALLACLRGHEGWVTSVSYDHAGGRIVTGSNDHTVRTWDSESGDPIVCLCGHEARVTSVSFDHAGRRIVSGSIDDTVRTWDAESGAPLACLRGHEDWVNCVSFDPAGRRIVSGSNDGTVRTWDAESGALLACLRGHENEVTSVSFDPAGKRIVSGSNDKTVRIWDAESGALLLCLRGHEDEVTSVSFDPAGRRIVSGSWDMTVRIWDAESGALLVCLRGHENAVKSVSFDPAGRRIVSGSNDRTVRVWDAESGGLLPCVQRHYREVTSISFDHTGWRMISGSYDNTPRVWDAERGVLLVCLRGHEGSVTGLSFDPAGRRVVSGSFDGTVRVWDAESGALQACLRGHDLWVSSVSFDPTGRRIASASYDNTVRAWDSESGALLACLRGHGSWVKSVSFDPAGRRLVSGSNDDTVRIWDSESGALLACLRGHEKQVTSVSFDAAGRRIVSGSDDKTVRVWDSESGALQACLRGHDDWVTSAVFDRAGRRIVSGSKDSTVRVWDAETGACLEVVDGSGDVAAIAEAGASYRWRAIQRTQETRIEPAAGGTPIAWFPAGMKHITTACSGRLWAGAAGDHVYLIRLVGDAESRSPGAPAS
jgi:WD40 repeat protein